MLFVAIRLKPLRQSFNENTLTPSRINFLLVTATFLAVAVTNSKIESKFIEFIKLKIESQSTASTATLTFIVTKFNILNLTAATTAI